MRCAPGLVLALIALSPSAFGDPGGAPEVDADLVPPELPETPPEFARAVAALRPTVGLTARCVTGGERMEHEADARCPQWYAQIAGAGVAGAFAIGELFRPESRDDGGPALEPIRRFENDRGPPPRLLQLLAATGRPEAATYLVSYLVRTATLPRVSPGAYDVSLLQALRALTGDDPAPTVPWEDDLEHLSSPVAREDLARRWNRWLRAHAGMTVAAWRAEGLRTARQRLASDDIVERYSAIQRLAAAPAQRPAVSVSLRALLAREDLPAVARVGLVRLARQRRIPVPVRAAETPEE